MIDYEHLEALIPDDILELLEEQYLTSKEVCYCVIVKSLISKCPDRLTSEKPGFDTSFSD